MKVALIVLLIFGLYGVSVCPPRHSPGPLVPGVQCYMVIILLYPDILFRYLGMCYKMVIHCLTSNIQTDGERR